MAATEKKERKKGELLRVEVRRVFHLWPSFLCSDRDVDGRDRLETD